MTAISQVSGVDSLILSEVISGKRYLPMAVKHGAHRFLLL